MSADAGAATQFQPSKTAQSIAQELVETDDLQRAILSEALETGNESGRTICGSKENAQGPVASDFGVTVLPGCPIGARGMVHGGGGHDIQSPKLSLLDMANALFGDAAAIGVVGARRHQIFMAPEDDQLEEAQMIFQNALGLEVSSIEDVVRARQNGTIRDAPGARRRIASELDPLFISRPVDHTDLIAPSSPTGKAVVGQTVGSSLSAPRERALRVGRAVSDFLNRMFRFDPSQVDINLADVIFSQLADAIVLLAFLLLIGGRPQSFVRARVSGA